MLNIYPPKGNTYSRLWRMCLFMWFFYRIALYSCYVGEFCWVNKYDCSWEVCCRPVRSALWKVCLFSGYAGRVVCYIHAIVLFSLFRPYVLYWLKLSDYTETRPRALKISCQSLKKLCPWAVLLFSLNHFALSPWTCATCGKFILSLNANYAIMAGACSPRVWAYRPADNSAIFAHVWHFIFLPTALAGKVMRSAVSVCLSVRFVSTFELI